MKRYCEVFTGNSLGIISGKEFYAITYGEPMTLQDILKQEMPDLREKIGKYCYHTFKYNVGDRRFAELQWNVKDAYYYKADEIIKLLEEGNE